ncbi:delta-60 repeat domain-containing protein [Candidatus Electronema sp. PJ]|uniref:delta-60 repeat domain-containing protein n=1 Tax=Candidatus Electronema sp. PJ TaxID=3401572 RepID=UPI003AA87E05
MSMRSSCLFVLSALFLSSWCAEASAAALDSTFGLDGRVAVDLGIRGSRANAVIAQPDGKIVAAGSATSTADRDFMLFRLLPDGSLDTSFNIDGTVTTAVGSFDDEALSLALQADGKIVAGGYSSTEKDRDFALVRYNSDGSIDRSFGNEGIVSTGVGSSHDEITDVAVQDDGRIVITGAAQGANGRVVVLGRYLTNGKLDPNFGQEGFALSVVGVDAQAESVALSKEGRILVAGTYSDGNRRGLMVVGFDSKGHLDQTFGEKGVAVPADNSTFSEGYGMFVNENSKVLVAGSVGKEGERDAALFSFTAEGRPDSSFEKNGVLVSSAGDGDDVLLDVAPAGENIAAAGFKTTGENREFLLITYTKGTAKENTGGSSLSMQTGGVLKADALTTGFSSGKDTSTSLATLSKESVVAVGESEAEAGSSAAVSKYNLMGLSPNNILGSGSKLNPGNEYVVTGEPYDITRTTVIIQGEILDGLSDVTERGIVFGTMPNPVLKDGSSSSGSTDNGPVRSGLSGTVSGTSVTLSLTTDVDATCRYTDSSSGMDYDQMKNDFDTTGGKSHSEPLSNLTVGSHTYFVRCKNKASSAVNTTDKEITFTVDENGGTIDNGPKMDNLSAKVSGTSATLSLNTDVNATCKYDTDDVAYDQMAGNFLTETGTSHTVSFSNLTAEETYTYHILCKNTTSGAVNTTAKVISFTLESSDNGPLRYNLLPNGTVPSTSVTLSLTTGVKATCKYDTTSGTAYADMDSPFTTTGETNHSELISGLTAGQEYTYYVRCKNDSTDVVNTTDSIISFTVAASACVLPEQSQLIAFAASDEIINTALQNVGNFFIGTALAATGTAGTTGTTGSIINNSDNKDEKFDEEGSTEEGSGTGPFSSKLTNLKPGTFFYARAYAVVSNGTTYYGNPVGFRTADSCFVATAAYGSIFHPSVQILRDFRDQFLRSNAVSRSLIDLYYSYSPTLADLISQHSSLRLVVRMLLLPVIGTAWIVLHFGASIVLLPAAVFGLMLCWQGLRLLNRKAAAV